MCPKDQSIKHCISAVFSRHCEKMRRAWMHQQHLVRWSSRTQRHTGCLFHTLMYCKAWKRAASASAQLKEEQSRKWWKRTKVCHSRQWLKHHFMGHLCLVLAVSKYSNWYFSHLNRLDVLSMILPYFNPKSLWIFKTAISFKLTTFWECLLLKGIRGVALSWKQMKRYRRGDGRCERSSNPASRCFKWACSQDCWFRKNYKSSAKCSEAIRALKTHFPNWDLLRYSNSWHQSGWSNIWNKMWWLL